MGGINSLGGLNVVNVDFRPTVEPHVPTKVDANQDVLPQEGHNKTVANAPGPGQNAVPENPPPANAAAKSVVCQLDVLLLNAAGKSVGSDIAANVGKVGGSLVSKGVLTQLEVDNLNDLAKDEDQKEYNSDRVRNDPAITRHEDGTVTVDLAKAESLEVKMALNHVVGVQSIALPSEIDKDFYDKLVEMDNAPAKMKEFLDTIATHCSWRKTWKKTWKTRRPSRQSARMQSRSLGPHLPSWNPARG